MKKYCANKMKAMALIISIFLLVSSASVLLVLITIHHNIPLMVLSVSSTLAFSVYIIKKAILEKKMYVILKEDGVEYSRGDTYIKTAWTDIYRFQYQGIYWLPITHMLIVHTRKGPIYLDFQFEDYKMLWKDAIAQCQKENPAVLVDQRIEKVVK